MRLRPTSTEDFAQCCTCLADAPHVRDEASVPWKARQIDHEVPKTPILVLFLLSHRH
jgi:hypothetical protein